jgi:hypothetical protein
MPSFIVVRSSILFVIFHVVFEVSLLVEVRLRASLRLSEPLSLTTRTRFSPLFLVFPSTTKLQSSNVIMSRV